MELLEFHCPNVGRLRILGNKLHNGHDFVVLSNAQNYEIDYLIFLDSRGISRKFIGSLADHLTTYISNTGGSYLLICRQLELTTWGTLINFLANNAVNPAKIITNMGFVDFTPKKLKVLEDVLQQTSYAVGEGLATSHLTETYVSSTGEEIDLFSITYSDEYRKAINNITKCIPTVIINTPIVKKSINIDRKRPVSFYSSLAQSAEFNRTIAGALVVDLPVFDEVLTYDAVHYTKLGNTAIFNEIKDYL